jgi:hypothetical protein
MKQLVELQHTFQEWVLHPDKAAAMDWVSANGRASPEIQLSVYTHAYRARLIEVLSNDYPAILMAIGDELFNQLADDYIQTYPSNFFSLRDFGCNLPGFVSGLITEHESYRNMDWLYGLALFEWTLGQAFDAADDIVLTEQDISAIPPQAWPELKFRIHPSVHRLNLEWNIPEIWKVLTDDNPAQVTALNTTESHWIVWRDQLVTRFRSMEADEQEAFDMLCAGKSISEVCEMLATRMKEDEVPFRAAGLVKTWITQGLIAGAQ